MGEFDRPLTSFRPMIGDDRLDAFGRAQLLKSFVFAGGVSAEAVDRDDRRHAELADIGKMAGEIGKAFFECLDILLTQRIKSHAAMHLERAYCRHHHGRRRAEARFSAFDVKEFLGPEIGAEAGLGNHVIGELERRCGRDHRIAAMGNVGEWAAMDKHRVMLDRLHQIRSERVLQQRGH